MGREHGIDDVRGPGLSRDDRKGKAPEEALAGWRLSAAAGGIASRFAEVVCPPEVRVERRTERVIGEFELLLGSVQPTARHALSAALVVLDQGARLYPRAYGRRFTRLGDQGADRYVRALLARSGGLGSVARRLKGLMVLCYYELPEVKEEIGYRPDPYIADVSRRRLATYQAQIQAGETAVLATDRPGPGAARNGP